MSDADVLERPFLFVCKGLVDLVKRPTWFLSFDYNPKRRMLAVEIVNLVLQRDKKLRAGDQFPCIVSTLPFGATAMLAGARE